MFFDTDSAPGKIDSRREEAGGVSLRSMHLGDMRPRLLYLCKSKQESCVALQVQRSESHSTRREGMRLPNVTVVGFEAALVAGVVTTHAGSETLTSNAQRVVTSKLL